jgi:hypothetical protein
MQGLRAVGHRHREESRVEPVARLSGNRSRQAHGNEEPGDGNHSAHGIKRIAWSPVFLMVPLVGVGVVALVTRRVDRPTPLTQTTRCERLIDRQSPGHRPRAVGGSSHGSELSDLAIDDVRLL